ncbi:hypothetical protein AVEN_248489-1 [Araneus ventricosus]|uniref:Uncharacterized protein n=1 Tax=Araneus ventricosus TaxID=182803 RepID=A0A4Y2PHD6_ARAVE|nr:hypothetical protein AVEN_248489-1 [Araneus ventricosus]
MKSDLSHYYSRIRKYAVGLEMIFAHVGTVKRICRRIQRRWEWYANCIHRCFTDADQMDTGGQMTRYGVCKCFAPPPLSTPMAATEGRRPHVWMKNFEHVPSLVLADRRFTVWMIADRLSLEKSSLHMILAKHLGLRKLCTKIFPMSSAFSSDFP